MIAFIIIFISGIFLDMSFVFEQEYNKCSKFGEHTYYEEAYKFMRALWFLELILGLYYYVQSPYPYLFPIDSAYLKIVYHSIAVLMTMISGALTFDWIFSRFD
jgi:Na+/alanine symporter